MLTEEQIREYCSQVQYKPGWVIEYFGPAHVTGVPIVRVRAYVPDRDTLNWGYVTSCHVVPTGVNNEESFYKWLFSRILWFENHECAEFFQWKGERVFDPHKDDPRVTGKY